MTEQLSLTLRLDERRQDRVFVSVILEPHTEDATIGGVSVQLFNRSKNPIGNRLLLPIAGLLPQTFRSLVELRVLEGLPPGAFVVATAWWSGGQVESTCPADPGTELRSHMRGEKRIVPASADALRRLEEDERARVAELFPWVNEPMLPPDPPATYFEQPIDEDPEAYSEELAEHYGLDDESAEWLKELMTED